MPPGTEDVSTVEDPDEDPLVWVTVWSAEHNKHYFYHPRTRQTRWKLPPDAKSVAEAEYVKLQRRKRAAAAGNKTQATTTGAFANRANKLPPPVRRTYLLREDASRTPLSETQLREAMQAGKVTRASHVQLLRRGAHGREDWRVVGELFPTPGREFTEPPILKGLEDGGMFEYVGESGETQGPFSLKEMREWWDQGFFGGATKVRRQQPSPSSFVRLDDMYGDADAVAASTGPFRDGLEEWRKTIVNTGVECSLCGAGIGPNQQKCSLCGTPVGVSASSDASESTPPSAFVRTASSLASHQ